MEDIYRHTIRNHIEINRSQNCACACCKHIFPAVEIEKYIDDGSTAICPYCGCDAIIADAAGFELTNELLSQLNEHFF